MKITNLTGNVEVKDAEVLRMWHRFFAHKQLEAPSNFPHL